MIKRASFLLLLFCIAGGTLMAQSQNQEANLKAAFIYNFTGYIDWENITLENKFIIGIIGPASLDAPIAEIARTNLAKNKKITIKHFSKPEDISFCHILFISKNTQFPVQSILDEVDKGVLTISEEPGLAKRGTAINFVLVNDKLKFEINLKAVNSAGLKVGSQLLKLAIIVDR